jgi:hypothetical protein
MGEPEPFSAVAASVNAWLQWRSIKEPHDYYKQHLE